MDWEQNDYILIIEDDDRVGQCLTDMLQDNGHRVVTFDDGRMAIDYLRQKSILPRLILLDSGHTYGREFLVERRKDARISAVPVIGISSVEGGHEQPVSSSFTQMLSQPVSLDAVLGAVQRLAPIQA
jgi:DNA-binding response OmpR family regulator